MMLYYVNVDKNFIDLSNVINELNNVYLEVGSNGEIKREVGLDINGKIIHKYPALNFKYGKRGLFDLTKFDVSGLKNEIKSEEFNELWNI